MGIGVHYDVWPLALLPPTRGGLATLLQCPCPARSFSTNTCRTMPNTNNVGSTRTATNHVIEIDSHVWRHARLINGQERRTTPEHLWSESESKRKSVQEQATLVHQRQGVHQAQCFQM